jgi:DNA-binding transcriptional MerR regulator
VDSSSLTIGQVAKGAGVGVETVRFYEREGLVPAPKRRPSGYRQYPADTVRRIRFVQAAKDLGFTLKEIRELLSLRVAAGKSCADVRVTVHGVESGSPPPRGDRQDRSAVI